MLINSVQGCSVDDERTLNSGEKMICQVTKDKTVVVFELSESQQCTEPQCCTGLFQPPGKIDHNWVQWPPGFAVTLTYSRYNWKSTATF